MRHTKDAPLPPPRRSDLIPKPGLLRWSQLPSPARQRALQILSRLVAQQVPQPPAREEGTYEQP